MQRITGELAGLAERAAADAERLLANARGRCAARRPRPPSWPRSAAATRRVAAQARQRLAGTTPDGASRRVSLHDGDARPIAKGRLGKPVEFGYKSQVVDNDDGIVVDHTVTRGNPPDARQLVPAVEP